MLACSIGLPIVLIAGLAVPVAAQAAQASDAAPAATAWAQSVRTQLSDRGMLDNEAASPSDQMAPATPSSALHPVTAWARSVEAHLSERVHRVAAASRNALAWSESGMASWYGGRHQGLRTANGERFDAMKLTCAHPTLPIGTKVLVTSESTGRSVVVTVNDRGPFGGRIVDLSRAAAARIGMLGSGTANVTLQQASPEVIEVAQAAEDDTSMQAVDAADGDAVSRPRHDRQHTRHAGQ